MPDIIAKNTVDGPEGTKVLDEAGAAVVMGEVDSLLAKLYPIKRGAPSLIESTIIGAASVTRDEVRQRAVEDVRSRVSPELFKVLSGASNER